MKRRVGLLLALTVIVAAGTLVQNYRFDVTLARERDVAQAIDRELTAVAVALADLRAAQAGYVATGQGAAFWMNEVADLTARIESDLTAARYRTLSDTARTRYDRALAALSDFGNIDDRARQYVDDDQLFFASDLVFMDGPEAGRRAAADVALAREAEATAAVDRLTRLTWTRFGMNALAVVFLLLVAVFAARGRLTEDEAPTAEVRTPHELSILAPEPDVAVGPLPVSAEERPAPAAAPSPAAESSLDLTPAAELCSDLARIMDGRDLPALVERTATVLGAKGVVLWAVDSSGAMLRPALTHGYSDRVLARLGTLQVDAENVTSLAFRSMRPQLMNGADDDTPGALAVPLVTTSGCVGVLAAETRKPRPGDEMMALARIVAAQFSTVVTPAAEASQSAAEGAAEG
jgi:hypothetical protein